MLHRRLLAAGIALIGSLVGLLLTADHLKDDIVALQQEREEAMANETDLANTEKAEGISPFTGGEELSTTFSE